MWYHSWMGYTSNLLFFRHKNLSKVLLLALKVYLPERTLIDASRVVCFKLEEPLPLPLPLLPFPLAGLLISGASWEDLKDCDATFLPLVVDFVPYNWVLSSSSLKDTALPAALVLIFYIYNKNTSLDTQSKCAKKKEH